MKEKCTLIIKNKKYSLYTNSGSTLKKSCFSIQIYPVSMDLHILFSETRKNGKVFEVGSKFMNADEGLQFADEIKIVVFFVM